MKKTGAYFFAFIIIFSVSFFSCKKYPDGPVFSLETKKARLCNSWKLESYYYNGFDSTASAKNYFLKDYALNINKSGDYSFSYNYSRRGFLFSVDEAGKWVFSNSKKDVIFTKASGNTTPAVGSNGMWEILRLKEKELWAKYTEDNNVIEIHLN